MAWEKKLIEDDNIQYDIVFSDGKKDVNLIVLFSNDGSLEEVVQHSSGIRKVFGFDSFFSEINTYSFKHNQPDCVVKSYRDDNSTQLSSVGWKSCLAPRVNSNYKTHFADLEQQLPFQAQLSLNNSLKTFFEPVDVDITLMGTTTSLPISYKLGK